LTAFERSEEKISSAVQRLHSLGKQDRFVLETLKAAENFARREHAGLIQAATLSQDPEFLKTVLNAAIADCLQLIVDEISDEIKDQRDLSEKEMLEMAEPVFQKHAKVKAEVRSGFYAYAHLLEKKSVRAFEDVMSEAEIESRYGFLVEQYVRNCELKMKTALKNNPEIRKLYQESLDLGWEARARVFCDLIVPRVEK